MILDIVKFPDELLKQRSKPVVVFDDKLANFVADLIETMHEKDGCGLAAVQVGVLENIFVIDAYDGEFDKKILENTANEYERREVKYKLGRNPKAFINPKIIQKCGNDELMEEGCLSIPGIHEKVKRNTEVIVEYQDLKGNKKVEKFVDFPGQIIQHETDHTNGIVFLDHLSKIKRDMVIKKINKNVKKV